MLAHGDSGTSTHVLSSVYGVASKDNVWMKVYCAHAIKKFHKNSNFWQCHQCPAGWYALDTVPLVLIGYTDPEELGAVRKEKDLSKKKFKRCKWCKDTIEQRSHWLCKVQEWLDGITVGPAPEKRK